MTKFLTGMCSDIGICRKMNQDAALIRQAKTDKGDVLFAVVCDGMGGLERGELASSTVISEMSDWFEQIFPKLIYRNFTPESIKNSWMKVLLEVNSRICLYGKERFMQLGTTITALLLVEDRYCICNIGDSRIYHLKDHIRQITRDQSYVQQEMDMGRMTAEEALHSDKQNVLLQCIGVKNSPVPDFYIGKYEKGSAFLLCSDGFWHQITDQEIMDMFRLNKITGEEDIEERLQNLIEQIKARGERDNITAILIDVI